MVIIVSHHEYGIIYGTMALTSNTVVEDESASIMKQLARSVAGNNLCLLQMVFEIEDTIN